MVERRPGHRPVEHAGGEQGHPVAERGEQRGERAVEFVAEAAAPPPDHLVEQRAFAQHDRLAEVDGEVLERDGPQVRALQDPQCGEVGQPGARHADPCQVGVRL